MLELAAKRAKGIDLSQPPLVRQLSLMDWYIAYELQVRLLPDVSLADGRNELHSNIQDVFNEFNVQIMSPNFVLQPENSVMVAKEDWYTAPAAPPIGVLVPSIFTGRRDSMVPMRIVCTRRASSRE